MDISQLDLINIERFAKKVVSLADYRKELAEYLHSKLETVAPNLSTLVGDVVCITELIVRIFFPQQLSTLLFLALSFNFVCRLPPD